MDMKLWLDDYRNPIAHGHAGFVWVKTADEAIEKLKTGDVVFASLDHDLADEHYPWSGVDSSDYREKTGYDVVRWMAENDVWPEDGVRVHSMNPVGRRRMELLIAEHQAQAYPTTPEQGVG